MEKGTKASVFAGVFLVFALLILADAFGHIRGGLSDRLYGDRAPLEDIVIVKIDDVSINRLGRWPWERSVHARLLEKLKDARIVGVDVSFFEPSANDIALRTAIERMPNLVLAAEVQEGVLYAPIFDAAYGYVNLVTDTDGITRKVNPRLRDGVAPFAFELYKRGWNKEAILPGTQLAINFVSRPGSFTSYPAHDVLAKNLSFKDKFVLIGATAPDLHDEYFVPTSEGKAMPGVEIHANILQNFILDEFLTRQGKTGTILLVALVGLLGMFILSRMHVTFAIPTALGAVILYGMIAIFVFKQARIVLDLFYAPLALAVFTGTGVALNYWEEKRRSAYLKDAFGKYVSKELLQELLTAKQELKLGGVKRTITVFFSDIRGFTGISESLSPEQLTGLLNEYLTAMTRIILARSGTVDKFIGDAIMALWNAPLEQRQHALLACRAAVEQVKALRELQKQWAARKLPVMTIGCGVHTGPAVIGNMGSEERFDYTAIGDTVNIASRLEGLTKEYGTKIIISEDTYKHVKDEFVCRKLDAVRVKGRMHPIIIYELCVERDDDFRLKFEAGLQKYFDRDFAEAKREFGDALKHQPTNDSCRIFIARSEMYLKYPPSDDWDGAFVMNTK
ncbi:adenylate/guanylate cyclase domain-containing protein [Candidatus Woesearchaeota archaeon]|nr:adenylate/guanylate cyclase domain-containing protein [Candidatus Woesearchaeota archaeon]